MSTASVSAPSISHLPHTAYPQPLREQAFTLHCQGLRSPAISHALAVPERTVRAWIAAALDDLKDDIQLNRRQQLLLAVERQHQLTAAAWGQFEREAAARDALLDAALAILHAATGPASTTTDDSAQPITVRLPASSLAPRYLGLILQADKEANRLLGLHTLARLQLLTPDATDSRDAEPFPRAAPDIPAESATAPIVPPASRRPVPAGNGGAPPAAHAASDGPSPAESATAHATDSDIPAESATAYLNRDIAAESATDTAAHIPAFRPSIERAPAFQGRDSRIPAKTATASGSPLLVGEGPGVRSPASPHPLRRSGRPPAKTPQPWMM